MPSDHLGLPRHQCVDIQEMHRLLDLRNRVHLLRQLDGLLLVVEVREDDVLLVLVPCPWQEWQNGIALGTLSNAICVLCGNLAHKQDTHILGFPHRAIGIVQAFACEPVSASTCCCCKLGIGRLLQVQAL